MGKVFSSIKHPFKNFNLESRAHKIISQSKPTAAPRHERDQLEYERLVKDYPETYKASLQKNTVLDKNLKDIFVVSHDPNLEIKQKQNPLRPLPTDKTQFEPFLYGIKQPTKVPLGKTTLADLLEFITKHQGDPRNYNATVIAEKYSLAEETVRNILKYFRVFEIFIPQERQTKANFAGPSIPKVYIIKEIKKELPLPKTDTKDKT